MKVLVAAFISALLFSAIAGANLVKLASANFIPEQPPLGIRIGSDGNVEGTDKIERNGNIYTLTGNIYTTIVIQRNGIVIDGAGYALQGNGSSSGIFIQEQRDIVIKNLEVRNFYWGIKLTWKEPGTTATTNNTVSGNTIANNTIGISLNFIFGTNFISGNTISNNDYGISIVYSANNVLRNNHMNDNRYNLWIDIMTQHNAYEFVNDIDASNTVDGKPIYYWVDQHDKTVPSDAGYVALINCIGITVQNLNLANNGQGVLLVSTNNSLITKNRITNNGYGIAVYGPYVPCAYNTITENEIIGSTEEGIYVWGDLSNNINDNTIKAIPEFPSFLILPLFMIAMLILVAAYRRKRNR